MHRYMREITSQGWVVEKTGGNHLKVWGPAGEGPYVLSLTPSSSANNRKIRPGRIRPTRWWRGPWSTPAQPMGVPGRLPRCFRPAEENTFVKQGSALRPLDPASWSSPSIRGARGDLQKCWSTPVSWAREELNLRPLPCQAMRAPSRGPSPPCMAPRQPCSGGFQNRAPQRDVRPRMGSLLTNC